MYCNVFSLRFLSNHICSWSVPNMQQLRAALGSPRQTVRKHPAFATGGLCTFGGLNTGAYAEP